MVEVGRHPNIVVLANTDVESVKGKAGNFQVLLTRRPRYIDESLCVGCRNCASYCPVEVPNPFDEKLSAAKAIDVLCAQAVPAAPRVDPEACLYFQNKCTICIPVCQAKAIDFKQKRKRVLARVGAIVLSSGYEIIDAKRLDGYGYGTIKNVVTSMEFERLLNADGPFHGKILRPSDGRVPKKIAWLQCIGSRTKRNGQPYCSSICCTYAIKQIVLAKSHYAELEITVFHNDIRTFGKGCEELYQRSTKTIGIRFIHQRINEIAENPNNKNIIIRHLSGGIPVKEEFEMVVLSVGVQPSKDNEVLSQALGLELNDHGFLSSGSEVQSGIYAGGNAIGPMDIPDSIISSTSAVSYVSRLLADQRGSMVKAQEFPEERSITGECPKIGVFICHCGTNIAGVADVDSLIAHASALREVVYCEDHLISCSPDSCRRISEVIKEKKINRVVVAACTPRDHEAVFQDTLREAGLNPYLLAIANIREHCTWVHSLEKEKATEKAKDIISMAVAKASRLRPLRQIELPVKPTCLVLGGGLAGMTAALAVAKQGFGVYLVEKEPELGGNLRYLGQTLEGMEVGPYLKNLTTEVHAENNITVYKGYQLRTFSGHVGNFSSKISRKGNEEENGSREEKDIELHHGVTIVATGGKPLQPSEYRYGESDRVVTQREFESFILPGEDIKQYRQVAMIQCVGARSDERPYCSRICCGTALKNALRLKQMNKDVDIVIFYRDMRAYGFIEDYYTKAREEGIVFIRYSPRRAPTVEIEEDEVLLKFYEPVLDREGKLRPDLVVLSTPVVPGENKDLAKLLKVPVSVDGFFMEAHMKLRPLDFSTDGIFLCGMAQFPKYIEETVRQSNGAAVRAVTILSQKSVTSSGAVAEVEITNCIGCGLCEKVCPYGAIRLEDINGEEKARVIPAVCKGCGVCVSECPKNAITHHYFTDEQIMSQIDAAYGASTKEDHPKILAFLCHWCGYAAADLAGVSRIQYALNVRIVRIMCSGRIHAKFIYEGFLKGMDGIIVIGCHEEDCHYVSGVQHGVKKIRSTQKKLEKIGIEPGRVNFEMCSAAEGSKFTEVINGFTSDIRELGTLKLDKRKRSQLVRLRRGQKAVRDNGEK
jgi:heterodisulfide reductase subunit A